MIFKYKLFIVNLVINSLIVLLGNSSACFGQATIDGKEYTQAEMDKKYERFYTGMERVTELRERGYPPRALEAARDAVKTAEEEFSKTDIIVARALFPLAELLGEQKLYEEAEATFDRIIKILKLADEADTVYSIAYRLRISRIYLKWNKFEKAEEVLIDALKIIKFSDHAYDRFIKPITVEVEEIEFLKEVNKYRAEEGQENKKTAKDLLKEIEVLNIKEKFRLPARYRK